MPDTKPPFRITGTPGEPVRLNTLRCGEWYTSAICPVPDGLGIIYPNMIVRYDGKWVITVRRDFSSGKDAADLLVHPLTRHEHDDGTVEYRHVNPEPQFVTGLQADMTKCPACNGTGVKSAPTYLRQLPLAVCEDLLDLGVRLVESGYNRSAADSVVEKLARTIFEHRNAIFAAGEPVPTEKQEQKYKCQIGGRDTFAVGNPLDGTVYVHASSWTFISSDDALKAARCMVAIALASKCRERLEGK